MPLAVVGAGSWGTAMAAMLAARDDTVLWARRAELAEAMESRRKNPDYLPQLALPPQLRVTASVEEAVADADVVVMCVPSHGFRAVMSSAAPALRPGVPVVSLTKGMEQATGMRMTEVMAEVAPDQPTAVLTGPNLVDEVVAGHPTASVVASDDAALAERLQTLFTTSSFRVYTNADVVGCELGGALKNVFAIAAGIADGMGFGDNTRAALVTRGLAELARLGTALGGRWETFAGLAGLGDLVATCTSRRSRNRSVGERLGRGLSPESVVSGTRMVAEGVRTCLAVRDLAVSRGVEMPIVEQVVAVVHEGRPAAQALPALMAREAKPEVYGPA